MLNQKGQTFDVFKLVISAIIAVAILGILVGIMSNIFTPGQKPIDEAVRLVSTQVNSIGSLASSNEVKFEANDQTMSSYAIADRSGALDSSQVCLSIGEYATDSSGSPKFSVEDLGDGSLGTKLVHNGSTSLQAQLKVICAPGKNLKSFASPFADACKCITKDDLCCVVYVVKK